MLSCSSVWNALSCPCRFAIKPFDACYIGINRLEGTKRKVIAVTTTIFLTAVPWAWICMQAMQRVDPDGVLPTVVLFGSFVGANLTLSLIVYRYSWIFCDPRDICCRPPQAILEKLREELRGASASYKERLEPILNKWPPLLEEQPQSYNAM